MPYSIFFHLDSVPFTEAVLSGESSLGGSESACMGLAEALAQRGHDVHCFATHLEAEGIWRGVSWHEAESLLVPILEFAAPDVFCSLRMPQVFALYQPAKLNLLWCQDLLVDPSVVAALSQVDKLYFVSEFHKKQWLGLQPILEPMAWVTRNGIDPTQIPDLSALTKERHRYIYVSRPERGLKPLLSMWPAIRKAQPDAELRICRYRSMYDGEGGEVAAMCARFDRATERVQQQVGGIVQLGQLNKRQLYAEIAQARLMLYPGVVNFSETNCIAATEAQACGTPLISSWKGALPETLHPDAGVLIDGDAMSPAYQQAFLEAVQRLSADDAAYEVMRQAGFAHALPRCSVDTIAAEWDAQIGAFFEERYRTNKIGVLRRLLHTDNHVAARIVAQELAGCHGHNSPEEARAASQERGAWNGHNWPIWHEAIDAEMLCNRVISQEEHTPEDYATYASDTLAEADSNQRFPWVMERVDADQPKTILDVACGNGAGAVAFARHWPEARITGFDFSAEVLALAQEGVQAAGVANRVEFHQGDWTQIRGRYDLVWCGEFLEHVPEPWTLLDRLEQHCKPGGRIVLSTPCGPFSELLDIGIPRKRSHLHSFSARDITTMCGPKQDLTWEYRHAAISPRGTPCGYWLITYRPGGGPAVPLDYSHLIHTERPHQRVIASMIVKDGADWLRKCLKSIVQVVDRVVVYDTGSKDGSQILARSFGATVIDGPWPDSFGEARNQAMALAEPDADWLLWIDADEQLEGGARLYRYATGTGPFVGYVIRQQHLMTDQDSFADRPVRLFKLGRGVQFFGAVHEQPEEAPDKGIFPALEIPDMQILHLGYTNDAIRRDKLVNRNLPLLRQAITSPNARQLDYVLALRDLVNLALFERERQQALTPQVESLLRQAVGIYRQHFLDPAHKYHDLGRPFYEQALDWLGAGVQAEWGFAAGAPKLEHRVKPERLRALTPKELQTEVGYKLSGFVKQLEGPTIDCEPWVSRNGDGSWRLPAVVDPVLLAQAQG
jgi:ubiquinone/menaquinone biosynthesis C-methylase UbiE/glycosyltransferase involved in cell wall biosynthesis